MNFSRARALVGLAAFAMVLSVANAFGTGTEAGNQQGSLQENHQLQVSVQTKDRVDGNLRLGPLTNTTQLDDYLRALGNECNKYPADFFSRAGGLGNSPVRRPSHGPGSHCRPFLRAAKKNSI